jgi:8-oxo-dGTP pyrophosphatase MutT (NUDIX family)
MISKTKPEGFDQKFEVASCFIEHEGKILLLHRQDDNPQGNTWGVPAGKRESGEEIVETIIREMREEIGYEAAADSLTYFGSYFVRYPEYDFVYHIFHHAPKELPEIDLDLSEHKAYIWTTPEDALKMDLIQDEDFCIKAYFQL